MHGIQAGIIAAEGERRRRGRFRDRNPNLDNEVQPPTAPPDDIVVKVFLRYQTRSQGWYQMPSHQPATSHQPAPTKTCPVTNYGEAGKLVVPAGQMIDAIEIKTKGGFFGNFHSAWRFGGGTGGDYKSMMRHRSMLYFQYTGRTYHVEMAKWFDAATTDETDITSASQGNRWGNSYYVNKIWGSRSISTQPVFTCVDDGSHSEGYTYRIWDAWKGLVGWRYKRYSDMWIRRSANQQQLQEWARGDRDTDFLRKRLFAYDLRGSSYNTAYFNGSHHPRACGIHFLSTGYNTASPRIVNFDLSGFIPGKRFVIKQEF